MKRLAARRQGFTLLELLMAMSISAGLLVAVSTAFNASADAVAGSQVQEQCLQTGRAALDLMIRDVRCADQLRLVESPAALEVIRPAEQRSAGELFRRYVWHPQDQTLTLQIVTAGEGGSERPIAEHIRSCRFVAGEKRQISIQLTCSEKEASIELDDAAAPRRLVGR